MLREQAFQPATSKMSQTRAKRGAGFQPARYAPHGRVVKRVLNYYSTYSSLRKNVVWIHIFLLFFLTRLCGAYLAGYKPAPRLACV